MKRKILLFLIVLLVLALTGCTPFHPINGGGQEDPVEQVVWEYWRAITNREYKLAKYHCILDGFWYNQVDEWEEYISTINSQGEFSIIISFSSFCEPTEITGNIAVAYPLIFVRKIVSLDSTEVDEDILEYEMELIRETSPGDWKLK